MKFRFLEYQVDLTDEKTLLYYKGSIDPKTIFNVGVYVREKFSDFSAKVEKKLFSVFMEMAQNVSSYSEESNYLGDDVHSYGNGFLSIIEKEHCFVMASGNLIKKEKFTAIEERCNLINSLDKIGLRKHRGALRSDTTTPEENRGNIGLVQIAIKSENPLDIEIVEVDDDYSWFVLKVTIDKELPDVTLP